MLKKCKANNAEAIQFHAPKLGVVEQLHSRYKSIKFHGNLKNECILLVGLTWNYPVMTCSFCLTVITSTGNIYNIKCTEPPLIPCN